MQAIRGVNKSHLHGIIAAALSMFAMAQSAHAAPERTTSPGRPPRPNQRDSNRFAGRCNYQTNWLKHAPHGGGAREVARRQRQIAKGMLQVSQ